MTKTVNRAPKYFDPSDIKINEKYFNFSKFSGLCDNKNYLGIDQTTFEDANNMYVDQDDQLSSRPPVKMINVMFANEVICKVYKINDLLIYHTKHSTLDLYYIHFMFNNKWYTKSVTRLINCVWWNTRFVIFTESAIHGFLYNRVADDVEWYDADAMIYIPITEIVQSGIRTSYEDANELTTKKIIRYVIEYGVPQLTTDLIGKEVGIQIDDEQFVLEFVANNEKVFTKAIGQISVDYIQTSELGNYIASSSSNPTLIYYSLDGVLFYPIVIDSGMEVCMSDDGLALYGYSETVAGGVYSGYINYMSLVISSPADIENLQWVKYSLPYNKIGALNHWVPDNLYVPEDIELIERIMSSVKFVNVRHDASEQLFKPFVHSSADNRAVFVFSAQTNFTLINSLGNTFSISGTSQYTITKQCLQIVVIEDGVTSIYPYFVDDLPIQNTGRSIHKVRLTSINGGIQSLHLSYFINNTTLQNDIILLNESLIPYSKIYYESCTSPEDETFYIVYKDLKAYGVALNATNQYDFCGIDILAEYFLDVSRYQYKLSFNYNGSDTLFTFKFYTNFIANYDADDYDNLYVYPELPDGATSPDGQRTVFPVNVNIVTNNSTVIASEQTGIRRFKIGATGNILTNTYFRYIDNNINLLSRSLMNNIPISLDNGIIYYDTVSELIYSSAAIGKIYIDDIQTGFNKPFWPYAIGTFTTIVLSYYNKAYVSLKRNGQIYLPTKNVLEFPNSINNFVSFSQTSLGIFLENEVYELTSDTSGDYGTEIYVLSKTKLQLGCKVDSDVLLNYDGKTAFLTTIKGLNSLTYQDFVQSTEQVYDYLTENIISSYDKFNVSAIKLCQFKNWIFMYRQDVNYFYLFDLRSASWWKWTNIKNVTQLLCIDNDLIILMDGVLYKYDMSDDAVYSDDVGNRIDWSFKSQKLHFNAPNNYKQINGLSITSSNSSQSVIRYKLELKNYRNLSNLSETDVTEQDIDQLTMVIRKVNFIKTNAFQFAISNDVRNPNPSKFLTPNVSIKYRITERIR